MSKNELELIESFRELTAKHQDEALYLMKKLAEVARLIRESGETHRGAATPSVLTAA